MHIANQNAPFVASLRGWERLGFSRQELRAAIRTGALRATRTGKRTIRVTLPDLVRWMEEHAVEPEKHAADR
jgi:excisionase family DNA binding protein